MRDEDRLVEAARFDREAFGVLYDRYFDDIYHYIARRVEDTEAAEDIAAATWERALVAIARYEVRGLPFLAWLYRIAGNLIANHHRQRSAHRRAASSTPPSAPSDTGRIEERETVGAALLTLSEVDQEILGLRYFAGLKPREIAGVLGCSEAAAHKRLHRARTRLRASLEAAADD